MSSIPTQDPSAVEKALTIAKTAQIAEFIRNNQILTAVCLFVLWQAGAFVSAYSEVQGAMC